MSVRTFVGLACGVILVILLAWCIPGSSRQQGNAILEEEGASSQGQLDLETGTSLPQPASREQVAGGNGLREGLQGVVRSSNDEPVAGATVRWLALQEEDTELTPAWPVPGWGVAVREERNTTSDQAGRFSFDRTPSSEMPHGSVLVVTHARHSPGGWDLGADPRSWPAEIAIQLEPAEPIVIRVIDGGDTPIEGARVRHVVGGPTHSAHGRFIEQGGTTDARGRLELVPLAGDQAFWAEKGELVSPPWQGRRPSQVTLRLGPSFTVGGSLSLPDWSDWDPEYEGERRILVSGQVGNLWRPLRTLRDVRAGSWGPVRVPLGGFVRYRVRLEGIPILPLEEAFRPPLAGSHRRIDFAAERAADLQLIVHDESGLPITNARVKAWWGGTEAAPGGVHEGSSRPDGRIHLTSVAPGLVRFRVTAPGYASFDGEITAPSGVEITLARGGRIVGRCTHRGTPVQDFQVIYWQSGTVVMHRSETFLGREDGSFELEHLAPGGWSILAASPSQPGSRPLFVDVEPAGDTRVELELPEPIRGGGRVIDAATNTPVPDAVVQVFSSGASGRSFPWGPPIGVSQDGTFDIDAFVLGENYVSVEAEGYARTDATASATEHGGFLDWGDIRLQRPQRLRIALLGVEALSGFRLGDLILNSEEGLPDRRLSPEGIAEYEAVSPGDHQVYVNFPDATWDRLRLRLDPGQDWDFDLRIAGPRALAVHVLDEDGEPLSPRGAVLLSAQEENGVLVARLRQPWSEGRVRFEGIRARRAQVFVMSETNEMLASRDVDLTRDEQELEIRLGEATFRIHVIDPERVPVAAAWLSIRTPVDDHFVGVADTDANGWASFKGLPDSELLLNVAHPIVGARYGIPIDASRGELEVVLEATSSLQLTLLDGDVPLAGVATRIETASGVTLADPRETDAAGVVRYERLGAGHYRLACRRADCWPTFVEKELAAGELAAVSVPMRRLADLELSFLGRDGLPVAGLAVELRARELAGDVATWLAEERVRSSTGTTTDASGSIRIERLPHGPYDWSVSLGGESVSGSVLIPPAKLARERLILP